jgi:cobaltochelatase CobT
MTARSTEPLAKAAAAVYGALARRSTSHEREWGSLLATTQRQLPPSQLARWRGRVDALAVRARFSDPRIHRRRTPTSKAAQTLFSLLEQVRAELLGARAFLGVRSNLAALAHEQWIRARPDAVVRAVGEGWAQSVALLARAALDAPLPP